MGRKTKGVPEKYLRGLTKKQRKAKIKNIKKTKMLLKKNKKKLAYKLSQRRPLSKTKKKSSWTVQFRNKYGDVKVPSKELEKKSGMDIRAQRAIIRKGQGAFLSSGSRASVSSPKQWGLARLYAVLMGSEGARKADRKIIEKYKVPLRG